MTKPVLPAWAQELRNRYLAGEASLFMLHGNVRDLQAWDDGHGNRDYVGIRNFLENFLARTRDIVVSYNVSQGVSFGAPGQGRAFRTI